MFLIKDVFRNVNVVNGYAILEFKFFPRVVIYICNSLYFRLLSK